MRKRQTKETLSQPAAIPQLLSIPEVAKALSIGRTKVYDLINHDSLPTVQIGKGKRVAVLALQRWIEEHGQAS